MKILLSAYACEPDRGSEPGVGWHWAVELSKKSHNVWVLTRSIYKSAIEKKFQLDNQPKNLHFIYYDLPSWVLYLEKGNRCEHLYYSLWQWGVFCLAKKIHARKKFDLVHHVTWASVRQASFMGNLKIPFIFGPVAGGESAPLKIRFHYGVRGFFLDGLRDIVNFLIKFDPLMRRTYHQAKTIYVTSEQTKKLIPVKYRKKTNVKLAIGLDETLASRQNGTSSSDALNILYVGNFLYLKGMGIGIKAFAKFVSLFPDAKLTMVGKGPDEIRWRRLAEKLNLSDHINWIPWIEMKKLIPFYQKNDIFLFPSLHDSGGMVVLEAMANGLPVICLDLGGPGVIVNESCGVKISVVKRNEQQIIDDLSSSLTKLALNRHLLSSLSIGARLRSSKFKWENLIDSIYGTIQ